MRAVVILLALTFLAAPATADIAFAGFDGKSWSLWRTTTQGNPEQITKTEVRGPIIAGNTMVYSDPSGRIWHRVAGAEPVEVTDLPRPCDQPTLSPDRAELVVACFRFSNRQDDGALYKINLKTKSVALLYDGPGLQKSPVFSPDGTRLAFVSGFRLSAERVIEHIWIINSDGTDPRSVEDRSDVNIDPAWLDPDTVIFSSDIGGDGVSLWSKPVKGGKISQITFGEADFAANVSPDGSIAFTGIDGVEEALFVLEKGKMRRRIDLPGIISMRDPVWIED